MVGNTKVGRVTGLYGGKVIAVQVYPDRVANGVPILEGTLRESSRWYRVTAMGLRTPRT